MAGFVLFLYILLVLACLYVLYKQISRVLDNHDKVTPQSKTLVLVSVLAVTALMALWAGSRLNDWRIGRSNVRASAAAPAITEPTATVTQQPAPASPNTLVNPIQQQANTPSVATKPVVQSTNIAPNINPNSSITSPAQVPQTQTPPAQVSQTQTLQAPPIDARTQELAELQAFLEQHHVDLYRQHLALKEAIQRLRTFFSNVNRIATNTPHQRTFLVEVTKQRLKLYQKFTELDQRIENDLLTFWAHYRTGARTGYVTYTEEEFKKVADNMVHTIQNTLGQERDTEATINRMIKDYTKHVKKIMLKHDLQSNEPFPEYSATNKLFLKQWMKQESKKPVEAELQGLENNDQTVHEGFLSVTQYQAEYPSIAERLNNTLLLWYQAARKSQYAQYRIYYTLETEYILTHPDLNLNPTIGHDLYRDLVNSLPDITNKAIDARFIAQRAYQADKNH